jgi:hypothetical protein
MEYYAGLNFYGNFGENEMLGNWPSVQSETLKWCRPELAIRDGHDYNIEIYVDDTMKWLQHIELGQSNSKYKVCVLVEPKVLLNQGRFRQGNIPTNYDLIENPEVYEKHFDLIFTTYPHYMDTHSKFRYFEGGIRSYIKPECKKIYKKTNGIVCVMSNKDYMPGHLLRHEIRDWNITSPNPLVVYNNPPMASDKYLGTKDFMYELVIENEKGPFFSEKLIDAMLVGCIPIYWSDGTKDPSLDIFDRDGIITFEDREELLNMFRNQEEIFNIDVYNSKKKAIKHNFEVAKTYSSLGDVLWKCGLKDFVEGIDEING